MVIRVNRQAGSEFLGCSAYPQCKGTHKVNKPDQGAPSVSQELQVLIEASEDDPF